MDEYSNADIEDGVRDVSEQISLEAGAVNYVPCDPWAGTLGMPQRADATYERLVNESIDEKLQQLTLLNFEAKRAEMEQRAQETAAQAAAAYEAERERALEDARWAAVDGIITQLTGALTEVMMEPDTPDWTRELIQRRYTRARDLTVQVGITINGHDAVQHEVAYLGQGRFTVDGEVLDA